MDCTTAQRLLWMDEASGGVEAHLHACAACRTEARRLGELKLALADLREIHADAPEELRDALVEVALRTRFGRARELVSHPRFWRGAAVGAAAATAAAFGLIVARRIARPDMAA